MQVTKISPFSGKANTMDLDITAAQYAAWQQGALIQNVFPHLTADEREFLLTGITKEEWDSMFGEE